MKRWTNEKLDKEIAFAELSVDPNDQATSDWLAKLYAERKSRS